MVETIAQTADAPEHPKADGQAEPATAKHERDGGPAAEFVEADLLVEDISIDGMCGVY